MARSRNIKPGASKNEDLAECSFAGRLCFLLLPTIADRDGRLEDRPKRIKGELFPFDAIEVDPLLAELQVRGLIARYNVDGMALIQILAFAKHQNPHHREPDSVLPPPPGLRLDTDGKWVKPKAEDSCKPPKAEAFGASDDGKAPGLAMPKPGQAQQTSDLGDGSSRAVSGTMIPEPGSRSPESGTTAPIGAGPVATTPAPAPVEPPAAKAAPTPRGERLPADWALPKAWGEWALAKYRHWTADTVRSIATKFRNHWVAKTGKDATKLDWKATWENWVDSGITQREHPPPKDAAAPAATSGKNEAAKRMLGIRTSEENKDFLDA